MILLDPIISIDTDRNYARMETRRAVKALCLCKGCYVVLALNDNTHKIPGGGVDPGEDDLEALHRELQEECGITDLANIKLGYHIDEYKTDKLDRSCIFHISTNVYICTTDTMKTFQDLDGYEEELGMVPVLVEKKELTSLFQREIHDWSARDRKIIYRFQSTR